MENRFRIREVEKAAEAKGIKLGKKAEVAHELMQGKDEHSSETSYNKYKSGASTKLNVLQIVAICDKYDTTPDELTGWNEVKLKTENNGESNHLQKNP